MTRWEKHILPRPSSFLEKHYHGVKVNRPFCARLRSPIARHVIDALACAFLFACLAAPAHGEHKKTSPAAENLPTGMQITPTAARGSTFQPLNPDLPDLPQFTVDHPV